VIVVTLPGHLSLGISMGMRILLEVN